VTLLNVILFVFLIPDSWLKGNEKVSFIIKVGSVVVASGAFVAGVAFFRSFIASIPRRTWFKVTNSVVVGVLLTLHLTQMRVVPIYPRVEPAGARLLVDDRPEEYAGKAVWLSINNHGAKVSPERGGDATPYSISYKDVFGAIFKKYSPRWPLRYSIPIEVIGANVNVYIRKIDGELDPAFTREFSELNPGLERGENGVLKWSGPGDPGGGFADVKLPYGTYEMYAQKDDCGAAGGESRRSAAERIRADDPALKETTVQFRDICKSNAR